MKKTILAVFAALSVASVAPAAQFLSTNFGNGITLVDGTTPLGTGAVRFGTFTAGFDILANANDLAALDANFIEVYALTGTIEALSTPGFFDVNPSYLNITYEGVSYDLSPGSTSNVGGDIAGSTIYMWALNNATTLSATQQGIFHTNAVWTDFDQSIPNNNTLFSPDSGAAGLTADIGSLATGADIGAGANSHQLAAVAVPEPSRAMLLLGGAVALFFRRRRA